MQKGTATYLLCKVFAHSMLQVDRSFSTKYKFSVDSLTFLLESERSHGLIQSDSVRVGVRTEATDVMQ